MLPSQPIALTLLEPTPALRLSYLSLASESLAAGEVRSYHEKALQDYDAFLREIAAHKLGEGLPPGFVPYDSFCLVRNGVDVLGESRLRHHLSDTLLIEGGHIGYMIRPSERRKGYGAQILALTLEKARQRGLRRVLVTCDTSNIASARIIEKNGGLLENYAVSPRSGVQVSRYWIDL